jgi:hypothetical protein
MKALRVVTDFDTDEMGSQESCRSDREPVNSLAWVRSVEPRPLDHPSIPRIHSNATTGFQSAPRLVIRGKAE